MVSGSGICGAFEVMQYYLIVFETGENVLIYAGEGLSLEECRKFAQKVGGAVADAYEVGADELQYYCIDSRVWADTPEKIQKLKNIINK